LILYLATINPTQVLIAHFQKYLPFLEEEKMLMEAVEPSDILQIKQQDLYFLCLNIPKPDCILKVIVENTFTELQNRVL